MCPLSATMQLFIILVSLLLLCHHAVAQLRTCGLSVSPVIPIEKNENFVIMAETHYFDFALPDPGKYPGSGDLYLMVNSENEHIAKPEHQEILIKNRYNGTFGIYGNFLGKTNILLKIVNKSPSKEHCTQAVEFKVKRKKRVIDTVFTSSVATLVSIIYINFGCALKWGELKNIVKKPIGPAIGVVGQFLIMPLLSFGVGRLLFPDNPEMQLGFFFTGVSPGGGASNVWVAVLDGNIDMSITMTAISTFGAFGMMPFWLFTLGKVIFDQGNLHVPYRQISTYAIALVIPLFIGFLMQRYLKKVAHFFVRILKVFSSILILFIIIFAIVTNLYLFELFSWEIIVAGMGLPWLGYLSAYLLAKLFRQSPKDCLTIAVETGIQNTGIAIFLLKFTLPQPEADLTTIGPVSVALMTPIPLLCLFLYIKIKARFWPQQKKGNLLHANNIVEVDYDNNSEFASKNKIITTIS